MKKVVSINLNGHAYQIDEDAYERLAAYLHRADHDLRDNPDRLEILGDLEQAIADKCQRRLGPSRSVLSVDDVSRILEEMGPVDAGAETASGARQSAGTAASSESAAPTGATPRRLYRIIDGAWLGGVCAGLAAFLHLDSTAVRVGFVFLAVLELIGPHTWLTPVLYAVLWFVIPEASTSEERAAAAGEPFNARAVIDRAKKDYADFKRGHFARAVRRRERYERRRAHSFARLHYGWPAAPVSPLGYAGQVTTVAMMPLLTLVSVLMFWTAMFVALSFAEKGAFFVWSLPDDVPLWVSIAALSVIYFAVSWPIQLARNTAHLAVGGAYHGWAQAVDGLLWVGFTILIVWYAYNHVQPVREVIDRLPELLPRINEWIARHRHR